MTYDMSIELVLTVIGAVLGLMTFLYSIRLMLKTRSRLSRRKVATYVLDLDSLEDIGGDQPLTIREFRKTGTQLLTTQRTTYIAPELESVF